MSRSNKSDIFGHKVYTTRFNGLKMAILDKAGIHMDSKGKTETVKKTSFLNKALNGALTLVRGPFFLSVVSLSLLLVIPAAQATLLKGYLRADDSAPSTQQQQPAVPGLVEDEPGADSAVAAEPVASPAEAVMQRRAAQLQGVLASSDSFPPSFAGTWRAITVVVGSAVSTVPVGQRVESAVSFMPARDGRILAEWQQPGWTAGEERIMPVSDREAQMERTNYFVTRGGGGSWAAHSRDHYLKLDADRMAASSDVDQYVGGQFMGRYSTKSMLYRMDGPLSLKQ